MSDSRGLTRSNGELAEPIAMREAYDKAGGESVRVRPLYVVESWNLRALLQVLEKQHMSGGKNTVLPFAKAFWLPPDSRKG